MLFMLDNNGQRKMKHEVNKAMINFQRALSNQERVIVDSERVFEMHTRGGM